MKNKLIILFLTFITLSCKNNQAVKTTNETLLFYSDDSKKVFKRIKDKTYFDSIYIYYKNGNIFKKGKSRKNGKPFGIWNLYSKDSKLREIREWFVIRGHSRINRVWFLDKKGDTLAWRHQDSIFKQKEFVNDTLGVRYTNYNVIYFKKDTLKYDEPLRAYAYVRSPLIRDKNSKAIVLIANSNKNNFNDDFSNETKVELDTFYNLSIDKENQKWFSNVEQKYFVTFGYYFEKPGNKTLRGYLLEYATGDFSDEFGKEMDSLVSRTYFEKKIFVKDSLK